MAEKIIKLDDRLSFDTSKRLGNGPNSIVYKGKFEEIPVAVKHIMYEHSYNAEENPKEMAEMREKKIMNKIEKDRHYNIIGYYYSFSTEDSLYLAMQLCDGNLKHYVKNQQLVSSYPPQRVNRDIASAVEYLHTKGIVHRDLKPENVFYVLRERMIERVIVGDFGLSKATCDDAYTFTGHVGTHGYIPHEIISQFASEERAGNSRIRMTVKSDIFSMGCIFYFTVTLGQSPFGLFGQKNIADKKQPDFKHLKPTEHSLKCLLETLLSHNPEERPDAHFVLCHPAFWEADTILNFLKNASDDIESKALRETNQSVIAELEDPNIVCGTEWFNRLPAHLKHHLTNFQLNRRYIYRENSDVRSALRIIRNVANHYKDFPKEAQEELEPYPDGHVDVWMRTCPTLFMHVYDKMKDIRPKLRTYDAERKTETVIQQQRHPTQSDPGPSQACKEDVLGEQNKNTQLTTVTASSSQDGPIPVGKMTINRIANLSKIGGNNNGSMASPGLADLDCDSDMKDESSGMETLQSLKKLRSGPYAKPVSVRVVACQKPVVYGENNSCVNFSVADKTDYSKAVLFDKGQFSQIYEGVGLILRNVILNQGGEIVLTKQTKVFRTTPPNVPDHILKLAMELIKPPAPDIKTIEETKTSPLGTMMSVIGKITQNTETNTVMVNNSPTKVRNIVIEDKTGNINIALWREHATACIRPGEYVKITHVAARNTAQGRSLQTTKHTTITTFEAPEELISDDMIGIATDDITSEILTKAHGSIRVDNRLLEEKLNCTIDEIVQQIPVTVKFVLKGQELVRFVD